MGGSARAQQWWMQIVSGEQNPFLSAYIAGFRPNESVFLIYFSFFRPVAAQIISRLTSQPAVQDILPQPARKLQPNFVFRRVVCVQQSSEVLPVRASSQSQRWQRFQSWAGCADLIGQRDEMDRGALESLQMGPVGLRKDPLIPASGSPADVESLQL